MTAPLRGTPRSSALPASQNTAPVAEFRCLFTHDVRRKQKRWQDGYLKFHTFNNRVMVYDQSRNFLGDTYYKDSNELHEGDELNLDKGVMIEVAEPMGVTQTDLTPLFEKKPKEPPVRPNAASQTRPFQRPTSVAPQTTSQLRHKSLNSLLGTPRGPIGKSVPLKSPYEARKEKENNIVEERPPKRQKTTPQGGILEGIQSSLRRKPRAKVIVLDAEPEPAPAFFSDVTLPSTPPGHVRPRSEPSPQPQPIVKPVVIEKPPVQTPKIPQGKVPVPSVKAVETPKQSAPTSSPPVSASNRIANVNFAVQPARKQPKEPSPTASPPRNPKTNPKTKSLRLTTGVKRGTLLCQSLPQPIAPLIEGKRKGPRKVKEGAAKRAKVSASPPSAFLGVVDDPEVVHGIMDQQILVPLSPVQPQELTSSPAFDDPRPLPTIATRKVGAKEAVRKQAAPAPSEPQIAKPKLPSPKSTSQNALAQKKAIEKPQPIRKASPTPVHAFEPPTADSRDTSPAHTEAPDTRSRNSTVSPKKKIPLSTGGFRKKPQRSSKQSTVPPTSEVIVPSPRNESVPLPPHPLRASKKGPVMTTSELAALLQKPKRAKKAPINDPIEDDGTQGAAAGKSPNRNFRRVRSENDAPIPSTAEDWEKRNLPKTPPSNNLTDIVVVDEPDITVVGAADVVPVVTTRKNNGLSALIKKTDPRRKFQRTQSLSVQTNIPPVEVDIPSPVVDQDVGPWSTEAYDLFDWRPPGRE
ncbi:hypothetical protein N0V83_009737 [Neocucurbitaria cava]|uniref:5'-3' DNA helicase ZGRF1-like N-terminal domain-containing protein n=1 Tax=Neocucurbitaria cava TaxID=798079 RepID=A0A9W8Y0T1_9PLEO|nr:hypothetical protein N0V83_009737 [Neocucurbitaria cava]